MEEIIRIVSIIAGTLLLFVVALDAFQSIILPRRPVGRFRITRIFFLLTWQPWKFAAALVKSRPKREQFFSVYGPLSLLMLFFVWAILLVVGFGLVAFGLQVAFQDPMLKTTDAWPRLLSCLYVSGTTLFTLGLGDVIPHSHMARVLTMTEAGVGLAFVALVIGYVPVLYTSFSHREVLIALLDARAGSPPTAAELLLRHSFRGGPEALSKLLEEWERWCAEMLETHISYPILCYYRSQHDNQSWLSALITILDTCALLISSLNGDDTRQAQLTFAIGRHTLVDLVHVFHQEAAERQLREQPSTRLPNEELARLCGALDGTTFSPCADLESRERLHALIKLYEPSACALADHLRLGLPQWAPPEAAQRKNDAWSVLQGLRSPQVLRERLTSHVSLQSTAVHLDAHDGDSTQE